MGYCPAFLQYSDTRPGCFFPQYNRDLGALAGILGGSVIRLISVIRPWLQQRIPSIVVRSLLGGVCVGLIGLMAPSIFGVGYGTTSNLLRGGGTLPFASMAFGAKTLGFVLAMSAGLLGGTFAPSLFIGASLGSAKHVEPGPH